MVSLLLVGIALATTTVTDAPAAAAGDDEVVRKALAQGGYPWYDARTDSLVAVRSPENLDPGSNDGSAFDLRNPGRFVSIGLAAVGIAVFVALLVELWRRHRPAADRLPPSTPTGRIAGLPPGVDPKLGDPWAEALRCRERGDYARAIVCLFAHQLMSLQRIHVLRLAPGRTGRQLVRAIDDPRLRGPVERTLRVFESVYYGRATPSPERFEAVWSEAQEFERLIAGRDAR